MARSNAYDYKIESVIISADRWKNFSPDGVDIKHVTSEINIFESLDLPFLTANIVFLDNASLGDKYPFFGTERVKITLSSDEDINRDGNNYIIKHFIVSSVENSAKSNDSNEIVILNLIEERAYISSLMAVNKVFKKIENQGGLNDGGFSSNATDIIQSLLRELDQNKHEGSDYYFDNTLYFSKTVQPLIDGNLKVIIPNIPPLEAIKWICDRCVTATGFPFYVYASMADDNIRFLDLASMLKNSSMNNKSTGLLPYTFSQALLSKAQTAPPAVKTFLIKSYQHNGQENQQMLNEAGLGPSTFNFIDTFQGTIHVQKHNPGEIFAKAQMDGIIDERDVPVYDAEATFAGKNVGQYSAATITNIVTTGTHSSSPAGEEDLTRSYNEYVYKDFHNLKIKAKAFRNYLHKASLIIEVPGKNFILKDHNMSISNKIDVRFVKNVGHNNNLMLDIKKSGSYLIYAAKHSFSPGGDGAFTTALEITKLSHQKG